MRKDFAQGFFFLRQLQVRNTGCWELLRARAWSYWHGIMVWVILNRERERERLRFLLQERKVQMVVLKEKNVNGDDDDDDSPPL